MKNAKSSPVHIINSFTIMLAQVLSGYHLHEDDSYLPPWPCKTKTTLLAFSDTARNKRASSYEASVTLKQNRFCCSKSHFLLRHQQTMEKRTLTL